MIALKLLSLHYYSLKLKYKLRDKIKSNQSNIYFDN